MSFQHPFMIAVAGLAAAGLLFAYVALHRHRTRALTAAGLAPATTGRAGWRRHGPPLVFLAGVTMLLLAAGRPQGTVHIPHESGTVILAFDVSNSMAAKDASPTRLAAAQAAATAFAQAQPSTVDIGVVAFDQGALTTTLPSRDHAQSIAAINRLHLAGGTSLGQAILASLTTIVGQTVTLPDPDSTATPKALGYFGSATIVLLSDGEDTGGPDAVAAAELASNAGVHIETIGFGTVDGTTIEVDGYQVATALNEDLLTQIAQTTASTYHRADDAKGLDDVSRSLDLRITTKPEFIELTGAAVGIALLFLTIGGLLMINWYGRIL